MASTIVTKNSSTASAVPVTGDLTQGELAVNVTDKRLFTKNSGGTVVELGINPSSLTMSGGTANGVAYLNGSKVVTTGSALTFDGTNLGIGVSAANYANYKNLAIAGTTGANIDLISGSTIVGNIYNTSTDVVIQNSTSGPMRFGINGSEGMRLTSTGLGIGTSSPTSKLTVAGAISVNTGAANLNALNLISGSSGNRIGLSLGRTAQEAYIGIASTSNSIINGDVAGDLDILTTTGNIRFSTNAGASLQATLDSSGNLGLGVTPSAWGAGSNGIEISGYNGQIVATTPYLTLGSNTYYNGSNYIYKTSGTAAYYQQNAGTHLWFTAASGTAGNSITFTQAMTLDASGNLLVGTTSSTYSASGRGVIELGGGSTAIFAMKINNAASGYVYHDGTVFSVNNVLNGALAFATNSTERARIDSSGNLLVGTTSGSTHTLQKDNANDIAADIVNSSSSNCYGLRVRYSSVTPNTVGYYFYRAQDSSATRFEVYSNGGIANYQANDSNLSDRREKTNFAPASEYLSKICAIPVQTFKYIDQTDNEPNLGVVAQDVQAVAPELVTESNWGTEEEPKMRLSIYQTDLQYALMKCIQEQQALIQQLQADVAALKGN